MLSSIGYNKEDMEYKHLSRAVCITRMLFLPTAHGGDARATWK